MPYKVSTAQNALNFESGSVSRSYEAHFRNDASDTYETYVTTSTYISVTRSRWAFTGSVDDIQFVTPSESFGGSEDRNHFYVSSSGKLGFNTTSPKDDLDFKVNTFKIRSDDGTKETEFSDGRLITKKFGNKSATETTGSQLVLTYTPGTFEVPKTASAGDILGTVTWEDLSIVDRRDATAMQIQGKVDAVASDGSAIKGSMRFGIGSSTAGGDIYENLVLSLGAATLPSASLDFGGTDSTADRTINFRSSDTSERYVMGVDASRNSFVIHSAAGFPGSSEDFKMSSTGTITMGQNLTVGGSVTANSYVGLPSGIFSGSAQLPSGIISSSLQAFANITASNVSASSTVEAATVEAATIKVNKRDLQYGTHTTTAATDGDVIYPSDTTSTSAGSIYYLDSDGSWALADKRAEGSATSLLAVALSTVANKGLLLRGIIKLPSATSVDVGSPVYLGTSGRPINTVAGSGHWQRVLGYQISGSNTIYFNPDNTWVEVS